ncbi:neutrophil activating protein bacterioferritin [Ligilactobacillus ruminis]|uniref:Neutrophil activating protein bacterioferritin n=1 Tax=Ligilactobacillus ruminis TaxID=1623 RepID=A0A837IUN1_9LACO|nr:neutrophil activating protein bacterioferritin [Ligilactobacillus ruminis]
MPGFCLPGSSKLRRAASKVEQNPRKLKKCSTAATKFDPRGTKSRTKIQKIGKMFYSVAFAKAVLSQITGKS